MGLLELPGNNIPIPHRDPSFLIFPKIFRWAFPLPLLPQNLKELTRNSLCFLFNCFLFPISFMITWLQTRFQKGYQLLFLLLLAIVIVAFVFTIGAGPSSGPGSRDLASTDFFGYNLGTQQGRERFQEDGFWSHLLRQGREPQSMESFYQRAAYLGMAREIGLAGPREEEIIQFLRTRRFFHGPNGRFDSRKYQEFLEDLPNFNMTESRIFRILAEDFIAERAERLLSGPGFILPIEVEKQLAAMNITWSIQTASFPLDKITYEDEISEEELIAFHAENTGRFQSNPQRVIEYLRITPDRFLADLREPSESDLRRHFQNHPDRFAPTEEENADDEEETGEEQSDPFLLVKQPVREDLLQQRARTELRNYATRLTRELWEVRELTGEIASILERDNLTLVTLPAFNEGELPADVDWPRNLRSVITELNLQNRPFSDPVAVGEDFLMIFLREIIPASPLPFDEVREEVEEDLRAERRREKRAEQALAWREQLIAAIEDEETSFADQAAELDLEWAAYENFTQMDRPEGLSWQLLGALADLRSGSVSPLQTIEGRGVFIYVEQRSLPEDPQSLDGFADRQRMLSDYVATQRTQSTIFEFIEREKPFVFEVNLF